MGGGGEYEPLDSRNATKKDSESWRKKEILARDGANMSHVIHAMSQVSSLPNEIAGKPRPFFQKVMIDLARIEERGPSFALNANVLGNFCSGTRVILIFQMILIIDESQSGFISACQL